MTNDPARARPPYPRIPGGQHGLTPEVVGADQRARELAAMVHVVAELGYAPTTVEDVLSVAGVSRRTFYEHFDNKLDCFMGACREVLADWMREGKQAYELAARRSTHDTLEVKLHAALEAVFERVVGDPLGARIVFLEMLNCGTVGVEHLEVTLDALARAIQQAFAADEESPDFPPAMSKVIVGGVLEIVTLRLRHDRTDELLELIDPLVQWMLTYRAPGAAIALARRREQISTSADATRTVDPRGERDATEQIPLWRGGGRGISIQEPRDRIIEATTTIASDRGYAELSVNGICALAGVSHNTFRKYFKSKHAAFLEAYRAGGQDTLEYSLKAFFAATSWPTGVRAGLAAELEFFAARPALARIGFLEVYAAGPEALELRETELHMFTVALEPGYRESGARPPHPIVSEGIAGGIYQLIREFVLRHPPEQLPCLTPEETYAALAPFIGATSALAVALG